MRLRCARCGCYLHALWAKIKIGTRTYNELRVEPCARCLREAAHRYKEAVLEAMIKILWME